MILTSGISSLDLTHIRTNIRQITYQAFLKKVDLAGDPLVSFLEGYPKVATAYRDSGCKRAAQGVCLDMLCSC